VPLPRVMVNEYTENQDKREHPRVHSRKQTPAQKTGVFRQMRLLNNARGLKICLRWERPKRRLLGRCVEVGSATVKKKGHQQQDQEKERGVVCPKKCVAQERKKKREERKGGGSRKKEKKEGSTEKNGHCQNQLHRLRTKRSKGWVNGEEKEKNAKFCARREKENERRGRKDIDGPQIARGRGRGRLVRSRKQEALYRVCSMNHPVLRYPKAAALPDWLAERRYIRSAWSRRTRQSVCPIVKREGT